MSREMPTQADWCAVHAYMPPSAQSQFVGEVIAPLITDWDLRGHFFFLRYWQGGPHIRLRFDDRVLPGGSEAVLESVRSSMPAFGEDVRAEYSSQAQFQSELARLEGEEVVEVKPLGTVERTEYSPEYAKYGGTAGIEFAEYVFCQTSMAIVDMISARSRWSNAPIGEAVRIMAMSMRGAGLSIEDSVEFLRGYEQWWRPFVQESFESGWEAMYQKSRSGLVQMCHDIWHTDKTDLFYDTYATVTARARSRFAETDSARAAEIVVQHTPYLECLSHYLHTTNNRLGLVPAGEALAAYLMRHCLTEVAA